MKSSEFTARRAVAWVLALALAAPVAAQAMDLTGDVNANLSNRFGTKRDRASIKLTHLGSVVGSLPNPFCPETSSVELRTDRQSVQFPLDCNAWSARSGTWLYRRRGDIGAIRRLVLQTRRSGDAIIIQAQGALYGAAGLSGPAQWLEVQLNVGGSSYCGRIESPSVRVRRNDADKILMKGVAVPCGTGNPPPTPETTPSSTLPKVRLTAPEHGSFVSGGGWTTVSGEIENAVAGMTLDVNGVQVTPQGNTFSVDLPVYASNVVQPIVAALHLPDGEVSLDRVDVIAGQLVPAGVSTADGLLSRLDDQLMTRLDSELQSRLRSRLTSVNLIPFGGNLIDASLLGAQVHIGASAGPAADVEASMVPEQGLITTNVVLTAFTLSLDINVKIPNPVPLLPDISVSCNAVSVSVGRTTIHTDVTVGPGQSGLPLSVQKIDNSVQVDLGALGSSSTVCGGIPIDFGLIGLDGVIGNALRNLFQGATGGVDPQVAENVQAVLQGFASVGNFADILALDAPLRDVAEDILGLTFSWNPTISIGSIAPNAPALPGSFAPSQVLPSFGSLTPGGSPYDLALGVATSTLNQYLESNVEAGALQAVIDHLGGAPLNCSALDAVLPGLNLVDLLGGDFPLALHLSPTHEHMLSAEGQPLGIAPLFSGAPGAYGAMAELLMSHWRFDLVRQDTGETVFSGLIDGRFGVDFNLAVDPSSGDVVLHLQLQNVQPEDIAIMILSKETGIDEAQLRLMWSVFQNQIVPILQSSLGDVPLPQLDGLQPTSVESQYDLGFLKLFLNVN